MRDDRENSRTSGWLAAALIGLPLLLMLGKTLAWPMSQYLCEHVSLASMPSEMQTRLIHVLFVPLGAVLVVFVRLTLGLRVLGPFRSILLAVAFQTTGAVLGLVFLTVTIGLVAGIRPVLRAIKLPYFGRISVMLSVVSALLTGGVMMGLWLNVHVLQTIVYLPVVVLCLVADAFARTMNKEGVRSAVWRVTITALVAVVLAAVAERPEITRVVIQYPELLITQIGGIIVISQFLNWRLLDWLNPKVGAAEMAKATNDAKPRHDVPQEMLAVFASNKPEQTPLNQ